MLRSSTNREAPTSPVAIDPNRPSGVYLDTPEFLDQLKKCQELPYTSKENLPVGTVGVIWAKFNNINKLVHSFRVITPDLIFSKQNYLKENFPGLFDYDASLIAYKDVDAQIIYYDCSNVKFDQSFIHTVMSTAEELTCHPQGKMRGPELDKVESLFIFLEKNLEDKAKMKSLEIQSSHIFTQIFLNMIQDKKVSEVSLIEQLSVYPSMKQDFIAEVLYNSLVYKRDQLFYNILKKIPNKNESLAQVFRGAIKMNDLKTIRWLGERGLIQGLWPDPEYSALSFAAYYGHGDLVDYFLHEGYSINEQSRTKAESIIYTATMKGHVGLVRKLLEKGANIHLKNIIGWSVLHAAAYLGNEELMDIFLEKAKKEFLNGITLPSQGAWTALGIAIERGHIKIVEKLLSKGAEVNVPSGNKMSPFQIAVRKGNIPIARLLIAKGTKADDVKSIFPLHLAIYTGNLEMVRFLVEEVHLNINTLVVAKNLGREFLEDQTPLSYALHFKNEEIIKYLRSKGALENARNNKRPRS